MVALTIRLHKSWRSTRLKSRQLHSFPNLTLEHEPKEKGEQNHAWYLWRWESTAKSASFLVVKDSADLVTIYQLDPECRYDRGLSHTVYHGIEMRFLRF
jgi:hypothetical protein